jgi:hypothetical protein
MMTRAYSRLLPTSTIAALAIAVGCGDDATNTPQGERQEPSPLAPSQTAQEATVPNPAAVSTCLYPNDLDPDVTKIDATDWFSIAADDETTVLPAPEIDAWEWKDSMIGFYANPDRARAAESAIRSSADAAGLTVTRDGNVLRIDEITPDPADLAALKACLAENATGG